MPTKVFALLVAVDDYAGNVPSLNGCENDIKHFEDYLTARNTNSDSISISKLVNSKATRENIIAGFRNHLGKAGPNDLCVFYFSGHGSQEKAPEEFWNIEHDRLNETLVCYDSRTPGKFDLCDKEISFLLREVSSNGSQSVVILDCCHSGSGTRDIAISNVSRRAETDLRSRTIEDYVVDVDALPSGNRAICSKSGWEIGSQILMAACRDHEEALEIFVDDQSRGAFSYYLMRALRQSRRTLTYKELFDQVVANVQSIGISQSPQLELESSDSNQLFLEGVIADLPICFTVNHSQSSWEINAGRIHGLEAGSTLGILPFDSNADEIGDPKQRLTEAVVKNVGLSRSDIEPTDSSQLSQEEAYKAVVLSVPLPPIKVHVSSGSEEVLEKLKDAFAKANFGEPSLLTQLVPCNDSAELSIRDEDGFLIVSRTGSSRLVTQPVKTIQANAYSDTVKRVEHVAKWLTIDKLENSGSVLSQNDIEVKVYVENQVVDSSMFEMHYSFNNGQWERPHFRLSVQNKSERDVYVALLNLTERFGVNINLQNEQTCVLLEPSSEPWFAYAGKEIPVSVPDKFWKKGVSEFEDALKIIACTKSFDGSLLCQKDIELPETMRSAKKSIQPNRNGTLNKLLDKVRFRHIGDSFEETEIDDWITKKLVFKTSRPLNSVAFGNCDAEIFGLKVVAHTSMKGKVGLATSNSTRRSISEFSIPRILRETNVVEPVSLAPTLQSKNTCLNVVELSQLENGETVTKDAPLKMELPCVLDSGESLLAVAFDGEFFLPLGITESAVGNRTEIQINELPKSKPSSRSVTGSLRIMFYKLISKATKIEFTYPRLRLVSIAENSQPKFESDESLIEAAVAKADEVVICVHGIMGDTNQMGACLADIASGQQQETAVVTFDYENLNTPIEEIARSLKSKFDTLGIRKDKDRRVTIVAHSMGGLVSRWFIEREGGNQYVDRLVMAGTPNAGSLLPDIKSWGAWIVGLALNGLAPASWSAKAISALIGAVQTVDVNSNQMKSDSLLLKNLLTSPDPGVPYWIMAGNTSLIRNDQNSNSKLMRLWKSLFRKKPVHFVTQKIFNEPNDIAVSVASMERIHENRTAECEVQQIPCDHLTYFGAPQSIEKLREFIVSESCKSSPVNNK